MGTLYREKLTLSLKLVQELGLVITNAGTRTRSSQPHSPRAPLALRSWLVDYVFCSELRSWFTATIFRSRFKRANSSRSSSWALIQSSTSLPSCPSPAKARNRKLSVQYLL